MFNRMLIPGFLALAMGVSLWGVGCSDKQGNGNGPPPVQQPTAPQAAYTCSMHPEVTASQPGKCPKCGMDLVKK